MEDDLKFFEKEDDLNCLENERWPKKMQPKTINSKNNGCGTAPGNLVSTLITWQFGNQVNFTNHEIAARNMECLRSIYNENQNV